MNTYLYSYPTKLEFTEGSPAPGDLVYDRETNSQHVYLSGSELSYPNGTLVGAWNQDGVIINDAQGTPIPVDSLYDSINPIGNNNGLATDILGYHNWMGFLSTRHVQSDLVADTLPQYPADNQPIILTMERYWDSTPGWEGWGWRATIEFSDPNRAPSARAIGIYDSDWGYLYTTGAFVWTDTGEEDGEGQPIYEWQTNNPPGRATATKEPIYYAMLYGSAQEGKAILSAAEENKTSFFWEADQVIPGGSDWVDSGETVTGNAGTVTLVSSITPFPIGTQIRIEGAEALVTSTWAGQGLVLNPYALRTVGATIEIWQ